MAARACLPASPKISSWQKTICMLEFCHELRTSASGRKDREHQKTAMHTVATIAYDAVNPFELAVATEIFGFELPELGRPWYRFLVYPLYPRPIPTPDAV